MWFQTSFCQYPYSQAPKLTSFRQNIIAKVQSLKIYLFKPIDNNDLPQKPRKKITNNTLEAYHSKANDAKTKKTNNKSLKTNNKKNNNN